MKTNTYHDSPELNKVSVIFFYSNFYSFFFLNISMQNRFLDVKYEHFLKQRKEKLVDWYCLTLWLLKRKDKEAQ